jgi:glutathione S-transferase
MLTLCGFAASNYYLKVKLALLEKGVAFDERLVWVGSVDAAASPLGKVPFIETAQGPLCESEIILDYLEQAYPEHPLVPADAYGAAKVRELARFITLHLELEARKLYPQAFFGGTVSDAAKAKVAEQLKRSVAAFARLARFSPFIAGDRFTLADCSAICHLPLVSSASRSVLGEDVLAGLPVRDYLKRMAERPSVQTISADRKAGTAAMLERMKAKSAG